jgi:hypothetical protein
MRKRLIILLPMTAAAVTTGCSAAQKIVPDSRNPAHCAAAFTYGFTWLQRGHHLRAQLSLAARAYYEVDKLNRQNRGASGRSEGEALIRQYAKDDKVMDGLLRACSDAQDKDPDFQARQTQFMRIARHFDKDCQREPDCAIP